jgi:uncharacterized damage-inducible protein DinB
VLGCLDALAQCEALVRSLTPDEFSRPIGTRSGIGPHMRHCLEHFQALLLGIPDGVADYDARERDQRMESDPAFALRQLGDIRDGLLQLCASDMDSPVKVVQIPAPGHDKVAVESQVQRELLFLMSHTIHHLALMKYLAEQLGATLPTEMGVAYSTIAHQQTQGAAT